jgi:hypothetical protein
MDCQIALSHSPTTSSAPAPVSKWGKESVYNRSYLEQPALSFFRTNGQLLIDRVNCRTLVNNKLNASM